jgi:hypothetical protein
MCRPHRTAPSRRPTALVASLTVLWVALAHQALGQLVTQQVGGVSIDARGVVTKVRVDELGELVRARTAALAPVPGDLKQAAPRKVSLRRLEAAIAEHRKNGTPLADDMRYLAGLQRIQYVFVYPEQKDIVLAGPAEGWRISPDGEIVGETTNRPVMLLDDLLVALRATEAMRDFGISCSIDPTSEGLARFQALIKSQRRAPDDPDPLKRSIEQAMGPQTITLKGVPEDSHFARVLVAADYRMKRYGMGFDDPPLDGLPSYLQMMKASGGGGLAPRWWLTLDYDALVTDGAGLAWEFRKSGVKAVTEDRVLMASGQLRDTSRRNPLAEKWAHNMTARYEELAVREAIWGQLRNCMDLAVLAALISHHNLAGKCGWDMSLLLNPDVPVETYHAPHHVDTLANVLAKRGGLIVSASGGVAINPWKVLESPGEDPSLGQSRAKAAPGKTNWWWN